MDTRVIVTDAEAQAYALRLGVKPEGITVKNLGDRLHAAEHDDYCLALGLDLRTTWPEIRTALRAKSVAGLD